MEKLTSVLHSLESNTQIQHRASALCKKGNRVTVILMAAGLE